MSLLRRQRTLPPRARRAARRRTLAAVSVRSRGAALHSSVAPGDMVVGRRHLVDGCFSGRFFLAVMVVARFLLVRPVAFLLLVRVAR